MYNKVRVKVHKNALETHLRGITKCMQRENWFCNVEVKQHGTQADYVWVIVG